MRKKLGFTLVEIMIVVVIIGLLAVMAIPAFNKVRKTSQTNAITNNLRQIASAADQFYIQTGTTTATYADLVGTDKFVKALQPVAGENYSAIFPVNQGFNSLSITCDSLGAGNPVYFNQ